MEKIIKPIKITRENFTEFGDLISSEGINPIDIMLDTQNVLII